MSRKMPERGPLLTAVQALISEASLHGSMIGAQGLMFAAAQQTLHLSDEEAFKVLRDARTQLRSIQQPGATQVETTPFHKDLPDASLKALWAALCSMTQDIHAPEDNLSEEEHAEAQRLFAAMDDEVNARETARGDAA